MEMQRQIVTMKNVVAEPPLMDAIDNVFHVRGQPVIYCFGDIIFNPMKVELTQALVAHENVHRLQQGDDPILWWAYYLSDVKFRLAQEIPAHQEEYRELAAQYPARNQRRAAVRAIAERLSSPLYGNMISIEKAIKLVKEKPDGRPVTKFESPAGTSVPEKILEA